MSALEHETTDTPNTIEHFGRTWTIPAAVRMREERKLNAILAAQFVRNDSIALAEAFLSPEDFDALLELNPTRAEQNVFGDKLVKALGLDSAGNS